MYCLKDTENTDGINVARVLCSIKADLYVALSSEVIDLIGFDSLYDSYDGCGV